MSLGKGVKGLAAVVWVFLAINAIVLLRSTPHQVHQRLHVGLHADPIPAVNNKGSISVKQSLGGMSSTAPLQKQHFTTALPWRPVSAEAPDVLLVSAFWDTGGPTGVMNLVVAYNRNVWQPEPVECVFKYQQHGTDSTSTAEADATAALHRAAFAMPPRTPRTDVFQYAAGYGSCSTAGLPRPTRTQKLYVALCSSSSPAAGAARSAAAPLPDSNLDDATKWVPVEMVPELTPAQLEDHAAGKGPIAACTAPLHNDALAASMVQWAEFHKLVGIDKVFVYDFNSGPLLKPFLDYYGRHGLFEVFEWIIPKAIMRNPQQQCLLPFYHVSEDRQRFGAANCTTHQDNYNIAWWGQSLAALDCMMRAKGHYRFVAVIDFDEYLVPKHAQTLKQLLQQVSTPTGNTNSSTKWAAQYTFTGHLVCSGCRHQFHTAAGAGASAGAVGASASSAAAAAGPKAAPVVSLPVVEGPRVNLTTPACYTPTVGFQHMLWSSVTTEAKDHKKSLVDPLACTFPGVHGHQVSGFNGFSESVIIPAEHGVKLHDRAHDIHARNTFSTKILPLLWQSVHDAAQITTTTSPLSQNAPLLFPLSNAGCAAHAKCSAAAAKSVDFTMCNAHGERLAVAVQAALEQMHREGVFDAWLRLNVSAANVYGGHEFSRWADPRRVFKNRTRTKRARVRP